ncbi:MAG TPA: hypothetical protein DF715_07225 [Oceanicaulis sp.]|nr:hypothetical protein [Oceanicaulis sp.]|tara:strand:+ start:130 stop:387 length:258 start_codon:yes stop_codon:yes gene_type:complete
MSADREKFRDWLNAANQYLLRDYLIDFEDAGLGLGDLERYFAHFEDALDFVQYFAEKYDLDWFEGYAGKIGPMKPLFREPRPQIP